MEKHPPCRSAGKQLAVTGAAEISPSSCANASTPLRSTSRMTGTTRPLGVSTATPTL